MGTGRQRPTTTLSLTNGTNSGAASVTLGRGCWGCGTARQSSMISRAYWRLGAPNGGSGNTSAGSTAARARRCCGAAIARQDSMMVRFCSARARGMNSTGGAAPSVTVGRRCCGSGARRQSSAMRWPAARGMNSGTPSVTRGSSRCGWGPGRHTAATVSMTARRVLFSIGGSGKTSAGSMALG